MSLRALASAVRRNRWLWLSTMVLGLVVGLLVGILKPAGASATTTLLLQHNPTVDAAQAMATDVALLQNEEVAQLVVTRLHLHESAQSLLAQFSGTSVGTQVLRITLSAPSETEALRRANAVATAFLDFRGQQYDRENQVVVSSLQGQLGNLATLVSLLTSILNQPSTAAGASGASQVAALEAERTQYIANEAQIQQTIQTDTANTKAAITASTVLAPAIATQPSQRKTVVIDAVLGLFAGLLFGVGVVALWAAVSDRVRSRNDVAVALGAPVELSLGRFRRPRWNAMRRLRRQLHDPSPDTVRMARHLRARVDGGHTRLAVVAVDSLEAASLAVGHCAADLTGNGRSVLVVDLSEDHVVSRLLGVTGTGTPGVPPGGDSSARIAVVVPTDDGRIDDPPPASILLVLATLDPNRGAEYLRRWASDALVVVTAGRSGAEKIRANGEMLRAAGVRLDSAVLIGADPDDYRPGRDRTGSSLVSDEPVPGASDAPVKAAHRL